MSGAPTGVVPLKNCTLATVPGAVSLAAAVIVTFAGAMKPVFLRGAVMLTVGGTLATTVTLIGAETVVAPPLSVALAVRVYAVALAGTFGSVKVYGAVVSVPTTTPLRKNSTIVTVPGAVSLAFAVIRMLAGAVKVVLFAGAVMLTVGGALLPTVTLTAADVVTADWLSVALAVKLWVPAVALASVAVYGDVVSAAPIGVVPSKNCTFATEPGAASLAVAVIAMFAPTAKVAPFAGVVMLTVGGALFATVTVTAAEVVVAPWLSVALAVKLWLPAAALASVAAYGAAVSGDPIAVMPSKNCTLATVPGATSLAVAVISMLLPVVKVAPLAGVVMLTVGGMFATPLQVPPKTVGTELVPLQVARKPNVRKAPVAIVPL